MSCAHCVFCIRWIWICVSGDTLLFPFFPVAGALMQSQLVSAPSNELRGLFNMLLRILCLEDNLQNDRIKRAIDGPAANPILGRFVAKCDVLPITQPSLTVLVFIALSRSSFIHCLIPNFPVWFGLCMCTVGIIKAFSDSDSVRSYQCIKFLVSVCNRYAVLEDCHRSCLTWMVSLEKGGTATGHSI